MSSKPVAAVPFGVGRWQRIGYLLDGWTELDEIRRSNNAIIARLSGTLTNQVQTVPDPETSALLVVVSHLPDPEPALYGSDRWLHYLDADDIDAWAQFSASRCRYG